MKYLPLVLILFFCSNVILAQRFYRPSSPSKLNQTSSDLKQGKWVTLSGDKVKSITHYKDDKLHGLVVKYWGNGLVKSREEYRNDVLHGFFKDYYKAGGKNRDGIYQRGLRFGTFTKYWENGNLRTQVNFENDIENGIMLEYYKDGTLKRETPYVQGIVQGDVKMYNKKGELVKSKTFVGTANN